MSSTPYQSLGHALATLPFRIRHFNNYHPAVDEKELQDLAKALSSSIHELIFTAPEDDEGYLEFNDCVSSFAQELLRLLLARRMEHELLPQIMHVDGCDWELVFDPGPNSKDLLTDDKGRIWSRIGQDDQFNPPPFETPPWAE